MRRVEGVDCRVREFLTSDGARPRAASIHSSKSRGAGLCDGRRETGGVRRAAIGVIPGRIATIANGLDRPLPGPTLHQCPYPQIQVEHGDVRPNVAHLLLSGSPHLLDIMKALVDRRPVCERFDDLARRGVRLGAEEVLAAVLFLDDDHPNDAARRTIGGEERFGFIRFLRTFSASRWRHGGSRLDFFRHGSDVQWAERKRPLATDAARDLKRPLAHRRLKYPLPGCVPAEPDSVSSGRLSITRSCALSQLPLDIGVMPQKIQSWPF